MPVKAGSHADPVAAYSIDGKFLAVATPDGRVTAFSTESGNVVFNLAADGRSAGKGKQRVHDVAGQSFEEHTAACWVGHDGTTCRPSLVLGTSSGDVKACAADTGELLWRASGVSPGGVGAVAWAPAAGKLLAAGSSKQLVQIAAHNGDVVSAFDAGRYPLTALGVTPDAQCAFVASAAVAAWQPLEQRRLFKFSGHTAPSRSIAVSADGMSAVSIAEGDRHVALWQCGSKASKKTRPASGLLSLDHAATLVTVAVDVSGGGGAVFVAALSQAAELYVWRCSPMAEQPGRMQSTMLARITVGVSSEGRGQDAGILCAQLAANSAGACRVRIARSTWVRPTFETLTVSVPVGNAKPATIVLQPQQGGLLLAAGRGVIGPTGAQQGASAVMAGARGAAVTAPLQLRAHTAEAPEAGALIAADSRRRKRQAREAITQDTRLLPGESVPMDASEAEALMPDESEDDVADGDGEPTLGDLVAQMQIREQAAASAAASIVAVAAPVAAEAAVEGVVQANSLAVLLTQALRSEDRQLLERCLSVGDTAVITNSVQRLQPPDATAFLQAAVAIMARKPQRAQQLMPWMQALVVAHAAFFIASPAARRVLLAMHAAIDARCVHKDGLEALAGRMELVEAHCSPSSGPTTTRGSGSDSDEGDIMGAAARPSFLEPQVVYEVGTSDEDLADADDITENSEDVTDSGSEDDSLHDFL